MNEAFLKAFALLLRVEGGFSNHPSDSGGRTRFGITERVARDAGYTGLMERLPLSMAQSIAKQRYWDLLNLDQVTVLSPALAVELFDTGYNMGVGTSGRFLQRALNALNRGGRDYPDIGEDGLVGPGTLRALRSFFAARQASGEVVLLRALNSLQGAEYISISKARPKDEDFVFGWFKDRVSI